MQPLTDTPFNATQREPTAVSHTHYCTVGDVLVDASAAIAPGVVLQALPGSRIVIGSGVCLAGGVCVQAKAGLLTISPGATLGANVLIIGSGRVGANACISPGSTLLNPQVEDDALLPPNTLLGEALNKKAATYSSASTSGFSANTHPNSSYYGGSGQNGSGQNGSGQSGFSQNGFRQNEFNQNKSGQNEFSQNGFSQNNSSQGSPSQNIANQDLPKNTFVEPGPVEPKPVQIPTIDVTTSSSSYDPSKNGVQLNQKYDLSNGNSQPIGDQSSALSAPSHDRVYGRSQVSELISTLFPNRQSLNGN
ncbi:MAG: hypothetical protein WA947_04060 [Phormidesmis sp.]